MNVISKSLSVRAILLSAIVCGSSFAAVSAAHAAQTDITGPAGSGSFGTNVTLLPNGNFVVTDPGYDAPGPIANVGAIYLYDGVTLALISTLTGSTANDAVGNGGVTVVSNGNFVVSSTTWNGSRGAVTWGSGTTGVGGQVSSANSLVGSTANDFFGSVVTALVNGNYVVRSVSWDNGAANDAGAVTWGSGTAGVNGAVSPGTSLVGSTANDQVGTSLIALNNGNYVVSSSAWDNGAVVNAGAATWGSGLIGVSGAITSANSLIGTTLNDSVGGSVTALNNGNYVVSSQGWNGVRGAVTWGNGNVGVVGAVSSANSLVGSTANDSVGNFVFTLNNGNYVVRSPNWDDGAVANVGAVTWGSGLAGISGVVSSANSLVGTTANDSVGNGVGAILNNGNYVVTSPNWDNISVVDVGAATWGNGSGGTVGPVSTANSMVGGTTSDFIGVNGVTTLNNGNYVVRSLNWNGARGAVTWGNGSGGTVGVVSSVNSLVGSTASDQIGSSGVIALNNGNYVVASSGWDNPTGPIANAGAATWGNGLGGTVGAVSPANSLVGTTASDFVGSSGATALINGNYLVGSLNWNGSRGAVTWGNGLGGTVGAVSAGNSLVGSTASDIVGSSGVVALNNGHYVVASSGWDNPAGPVINVGAVTWGNGLGGTVGAISAGNSLMGSTASDGVGNAGVTTLSNGNYVVRSPAWANGSATTAGAVTWGNGLGGTVGTVSAGNSLVGSTTGDQIGNLSVTTLNNGNYVVRSSLWDNGATINAGAVTLGDGAVGTRGILAAANSVLGTVAGGGSSMVFAYDALSTRLLVGSPGANRVSLFSPAPEIVVEQPLTVNIADGGSKSFGGALVGGNGSLTFTIKNIGNANLTGLGITIDGSDAAMFTVTSSPTAPVSGPSGTTAFTVRFTPTSAGAKTAALHIASNDGDENPFDINLSGVGLTFTQDTDGDGMSDAAELQWSALGFDWQASQPSLVATFVANANSAGLFTTNQVQALNVDRLLLQKDPTSGVFTLTFAVQKSTDLINFNPFPMTAPQTTINGLGALEFKFSVSDNAAFFRLEAK